jgi:N-methylhydantoinase B
MDMMTRPKHPPFNLLTSNNRKDHAKTDPIDPIAFEVMRHRLWSINEEGASTLMHASGSPVVHGSDYNFSIYTANGDLSVSGTFYMIPMYTMTVQIQMVLEKFAGDIHAGDVFITNDPFVCGVHQNDCLFVAPFFFEGELVGWTGAQAHVIDIGGAAPGGWVPDARTCYEEGVRIPLQRIVDKGKINQGMWDVILYNSRIPFFLGSDFSAFLSAHRVAQARLTELCAQYGAAAFVATATQLIHDTEAKTRAMLKRLPDGTFSHVTYFDHDGHGNNLYKISCVMTKQDDSLTFDFSDTDPTIVGMGNATMTGTLGAVGTVMMGTFGQEIGWNTGLMAPVTIIHGKKTVLSAELPAPISAGSVAANFLAAACASVCVGNMMAFNPEFDEYLCGPPDGSWLLTMFGGENQYEEQFAIMFMDSLGWGGPAHSWRDGVDSGGSLVIGSGGFNDVELHEKTSPIMYLWRREVPDSGGAGRFRGGNGIEYATAVYDVPEVQGSFCSHGVSLPDLVGIQGGYPGNVCGYQIARGSSWLEDMKAGKVADTMADFGGSLEDLPAKSTFIMKSGDVVNNVVQNPGGYGDPLQRPYWMIERDVRDGRCRADVAKTVYGAVIDADGTVDTAASDAERALIRDRRKATAVKGIHQYDAPRKTNLGDVTLRWGESIGVTDAGSVCCLHCSSEIGALESNWRLSVPVRHPEANELGPLLKLDERFVYDQFICSDCGTSLCVDVHRIGDAPTVDFALD